MGNVWGRKIKISIFGESHGESIGAIVDGLPVGEPIDLAQVQKELTRRSPGKNSLSTPRAEADEVQVQSGIFNGRTSGSPICALIRNTNANSKEYNANIPRPSHADLVAHVKYKGFNDYRGGGHFSGRITAGLVFAGAVAKQILCRRGVFIGAHISQIERVCDDYFTNISSEILQELTKSDLPLLDTTLRLAMEQAILKAKDEHDSVGGVIECAAIGVPVGLGSPFFESLESSIASLMFSIPAVKGLEFGAGFSFATMKGSTANDEIQVQNDTLSTKTNHNGGIVGGISNGAPIVFRVVIKPTPSIGKEQATVDLDTLKNITISTEGRHDPCIVVRAVCVVEAALAICILDAMEADL